MKYTVALVKHLGNCQTVSFTESSLYEEKYSNGSVSVKLRHKNIHDEILGTYGNAKVVFYLQANDKASYLNAKVKCLEEELKDLVSQQNKMLMRMADNPKMQNETAELCYDVQTTLIKKIGRCAKRLMHQYQFEEGMYDLSELAVMCVNVVQSDIQAKVDKEKCLHKLNRLYEMSLVNPYC